MSIKDNAIFREPQFFFTKFVSLPAFRFQKILIKILIKLISQAKPSSFLKLKSGKQLFSRQKKGGGAVILQDF
jgi:hypothetical protein